MEAALRLTNAYALVDEDEHKFDALITTMNRELDDLRKVIARKKGGNEEEDEDDNENQNENPNPNDNPGGGDDPGNPSNPTEPGGNGGGNDDPDNGME